MDKYVMGEWTILDEDRKAQKEGKPYWTLVEGERKDLCLGPYGRKAMKPEYEIQGVGFEVDGIHIANEKYVLEALNNYDDTHRHTPLPWKFGSIEPLAVVGADGFVIHRCTCEHRVFGPDDSAFIIRACNSHEELLEALEGLVEIGKRDLSNPKYDGYFEAAKKAITRAKK